MLGAREDPDEPPKHQLETSLRLLRRKLRHRWLLADDVLQFRDEIDDQLPIRLQRLTKRVTPFAQVCFVLAEERPNQTLERLRQRGIRDVALVLVELAGCKQAAGRDERLVELVHDRRLADAGVSGDQHQLRPAARDDAIERGEQGVDLTVPPVQLLGDHEAIRNVMRAGREVVDASLGLPLRQAAPQIALDARRGLIALLRRLGEQLHRDRGHRGRHTAQSLAGCGRLSSDVAVHPFHRIGCRERKAAGQHLVERDAE